MDALLSLSLSHLQPVQRKPWQPHQIPSAIHAHLHAGRNPYVIQAEFKDLPTVDAAVIAPVTVLIRVMEIIPAAFPVIK